VNRSLRSSAFASLAIGLASLTGAALTLLALPSHAEAQILYDTTSYSGGAPGSTAAAIAAFDGLAAATGTYGCTTVTTLAGLNNAGQFGSNSGIAYHESAVFVVAPSEAGLWSFRWGGDFGLGGTLLLDGVELQSRWTDMWWNGGFTDPSQYLLGSNNLMAGTHIVEAFGFEDCCDGPATAQFLPPLASTWQDISATNLTLAPTVCGSPAVLLTGTASPSPVLDGSQVTFTFFYESTGQAAAANASLSTAIPANTTFVSATGGGVFASGAVTWTLGSLGVGVSGTVSVTVQVGAPLADATTLTDLASLTATGATTATATTNVTVSNALLTLGSTSAPSPVAAGAPLTITLDYANTGSGAGGMATIVDMLPANTSFVSATNGGTYDSTSNRVTFSLGALAMGASGSVSYVVDVATPLPNGTILSDMATFSATNNAAVTATSSATVASAPSLALTDTPAPSPAAADGMLVYTLGYANSGSDAASAATITHSLPANVTFQTASGNGTYSTSANTVTWNLGSIAAGASGAVTVTVLVASPIANGTVLTDAASLATGNAATVMANADVTVTSTAVLSLTETGAPNPVAAGTELVYTLAYGNGGTDTAAAASIVAAVPSNATFVSAIAGGVYDSGANQVTFDLGSVAAGMNGTVTFTVLVSTPLANGTSLAASSMMSATGVAGAPSMAITSVASAPTLSLTNTGTPNPVLAGSQLTYTLAFANNGTDAAHGVSLTDTLPADLGFISASNGGSYDAGTNTVSWTPADLGAAGTGSVTLVVLVKSSAAAGVLSDTATLSATNNSTPVTATAMTMVSSPIQPDGGSSDAATGGTGTGGNGTGGNGTGGTGTGGTGTGGTGAGGNGTAGTTATGSGGVGGSSATGTGGTSTSGSAGAGGSSATGTGGTTATGTAGAGGSSATSTGGTSTTGAAGAGGSSATGTGGAGGTSGAGTGGAGGVTTTGTGGAGGNMGTAGSAAAGNNGTAGSPGPVSPSSGCDCAVGNAPSPTSLLGLGAVVGLLLASRRKRRR
jgi:uncharacterized repeat protein (TIGR01451 family)/MYXO-CTERM domain-containing protein